MVFSSYSDGLMPLLGQQEVYLVCKNSLEQLLEVCSGVSVLKDNWTVCAISVLIYFFLLYGKCTQQCFFCFRTNLVQNSTVINELHRFKLQPLFNVY